VVARGIAHVFQVVVLATGAQAGLHGRGTHIGRLSLPRNTSLNCTMPELVNISVGSLPGTSGLEATTVWALEAKKSRKVLRMSATVNWGVLIWNRGWTGHAAPATWSGVGARKCLMDLNIRL
jgi:hypothetical protein